MSKKDVADHIFKTYPNQDEAFVTSDKRGFLVEHEADAYAGRLKDRKIVKFTRNADEAETIAPADQQELISNTAAAVGGSPLTAEELAAQHKAEADKKLKDIEVVTEDDEDALAAEKAEKEAAEKAEKAEKEAAEKAKKEAAEKAAEEDVDDLENLGFDDLKKLAEDKGIDIAGLNSKAKLRTAIANLEDGKQE